jgi:hypothetical protein
VGAAPTVIQAALADQEEVGSELLEGMERPLVRVQQTQGAEVVAEVRASQEEQGGLV